MNYYIGCDAHKKYSVFVMVSDRGVFSSPEKVYHDKEGYRKYLKSLPPGSPVGLESVGNWYWMVEEMEKASLKPILINPGRAKLMMGQVNKTDKLDAKGIARLNLNGTLPQVWIPPAELRDQRELSRMRMSLVHIRTGLKNRIQSTLAKYAITIDEVSDTFGVKGRSLLNKALDELPPETKDSVKRQLTLLDQVSLQIDEVEAHIREVVRNTPMMELLKTLPGVGDILAIVIALEIGTVERFESAEHLASYAGTVPRVSSSGGKTRYGSTRSDVNHYLKWAYVEAANCIALQQRQMPERHVVKLLQRIQQKRGYPKAAVAVARHLAEASYHILKNNEPYKEPGSTKGVSSKRG